MNLHLLFSSLTPSTLAHMIIDIEDTEWTPEAEELVNVIHRNAESVYGDEFCELLAAYRNRLQAFIGGSC